MKAEGRLIYHRHIGGGFYTVVDGTTGMYIGNVWKNGRLWGCRTVDGEYIDDGSFYSRDFAAAALRRYIQRQPTA